MCQKWMAKQSVVNLQLLNYYKNQRFWKVVHVLRWLSVVVNYSFNRTLRCFLSPEKKSLQKNPHICDICGEGFTRYRYMVKLYPTSDLQNECFTLAVYCISYRLFTIASSLIMPSYTYLILGLLLLWLGGMHFTIE